MRILLLTPGTGSFLCGSCSRDNTLSSALGELGHEAMIVPLYLPFKLEGSFGMDSPVPGLAAERARVHMGGINVFLQQRFPLLAHLPQALRNWLDEEGLLRWVSTLGDMTNPAGLGKMTISMLLGEEGRQATEIARLLTWLEDQPQPDVIVLSNAMLIGLARRLRHELNVPILCTLQGEQPFLDALHPADSKRCWSILSERAQEVDGFVAVSRFTAELMQKRLQLDPAKVHVVQNGIDFDGYEPAASVPDVPTIGFLARMCADKGLPALVDAFLKLRARGNVPAARLVVIGVQLSEDRKLVRELHKRCLATGAGDAVEFHANVSKDDKIKHLRSFSLLSVPAAYGESFGLYLLEAMACGVPVVQPRQAGFTEVLEATGGGVLYDPADEEGLVTRLEEILLDPERARKLGLAGRESVLQNFNATRMARDVAKVCEGLASTGRVASDTMRP
ncbi:MAG: glycosyltransferase involved in cell wall biosynthesis [Candidatus Paceibacteria bacterium]|jgi:glycosyltransferase involved in cell wall biosynthesis